MKPLEGLLVLDFSQFLSGPSAALRLADLGARVIKIERKGYGDPCRQLSLKNLKLEGDSILFHTINRNKESYVVDLQNAEDRVKVEKLITRADVLIENFQPGTMEKFGLSYEHVKKLNPRLVYGRISGYGEEGPWRDKADQDILVQALSGLTWLNGNQDQPPTPFGLAVADMLAAAHLVQGILACLIRRGQTDSGDLVEVSLLESILQFQFEVLTTHLNDGGKQPNRSKINNAHAYLAAPYGIYETKDGYIALAMGSVVRLGELLECPSVAAYTDPKTWFSHRDEIKQLLADHLLTRTTKEWLSILEAGGYWCADVYQWDRLLMHDGFKVLNMVQEVHRLNGSSMKTTRCPIRIDGKKLVSAKGAPCLGEHNEDIDSEFFLPN